MALTVKPLSRPQNGYLQTSGRSHDDTDQALYQSLILPLRDHRGDAQCRCTVSFSYLLKSAMRVCSTTRHVHTQRVKVRVGDW